MLCKNVTPHNTHVSHNKTSNRTKLKQMFNWHTVGDCQVSECDQPWFTDDGLNEETRVWDGMYKVAVEYEVEAELFFLSKLGRK